MLADPEAGHPRRDRFHLALNFGGGAGLRVERLVLRRGAVLVEEDARLGPAEVRCRRFGGLERLQPQEIAQPQAEQSQPAEVQQVAARQAVAQSLGRTENRYHATPLNASRRPTAVTLSGNWLRWRCRVVLRPSS